MEKVRQIAERNEKVVRFVFSVFVVVMVVAPIPPSTIIGLALIANKRTNRFIDPRAAALSAKVSTAVSSSSKRAYISYERSKRHRARLAVTRIQSGKFVR